MSIDVSICATSCGAATTTIHAAFEAVLTVVNHDAEKAIAPQDFALKGRGGDD